jgi:hypothetical protein
MEIPTFVRFRLLTANPEGTILSSAVIRITTGRSCRTPHRCMFRRRQDLNIPQNLPFFHSNNYEKLITTNSARTVQQLSIATGRIQSFPVLECWTCGNSLENHFPEYLYLSTYVCVSICNPPDNRSTSLSIYLCVMYLNIYVIIYLL